MAVIPLYARVSGRIYIASSGGISSPSIAAVLVVSGGAATVSTTAVVSAGIFTVFSAERRPVDHFLNSGYPFVAIAIITPSG